LLQTIQPLKKKKKKKVLLLSSWVVTKARGSCIAPVVVDVGDQNLIFVVVGCGWVGACFLSFFLVCVCVRARSRTVDDQLQEPPPRESYYASSDSSSVKDLRDVMEEQQWNLHSDPMDLTMQIGARSAAAAASSSVLPIVLKARTLSTTLLR